MHIASWILLVTGYLCHAKGQGDSLRSALNAIDRRQRDLSDYDDNEYGYTLERPEDIAFLKSTYGPDRSYDVGRPMSNYVGNGRFDDVNKRLSSSFRERVEEDKQKQLEEIAQNLISNLERKERYSVENEDYEELLREIWDKYRRPHEHNRMYSSKIDKRLYPNFGLDGAGLRKKNVYGSDTYDDAYGPDEENYNEEDADYPTGYLRKRSYQSRPGKSYQVYPYAYSPVKRFPVAKRSATGKDINEQKKTTTKQTDPNVEKELSNIFGGKAVDKTTEKPSTVTPTKTTKDSPVTRRPPNPLSKDVKPKSINKEEFSPVPLMKERPLQIKKKSIDWSDYFGLDRRKKSHPDNDLDKEWLIERYHKSVAMSAKKRTTEVPLSSFRNNDDSPSETSEQTHNDIEKLAPVQKIDDMDRKLQMMEDKIVDDTLKFTGAHQGETDAKQIQGIKNKVISRLTAAYSLEKMRNALDEYKLALAKEKDKLRNKSPQEDYLFSEEKRTAVPRKQVIDKDRENAPEADNNIKCTDGDEECHEQNYKTPSEIIEHHFGIEECPAIERACDDVASIIGQYGRVFQTACSMHQICLLCSNNSWFPPTRQCNSLFLAKAYDLCNGNMQCQRQAQRSVKYLLDINHSLHSQPSNINECELSCPDTDAMSEPTSR